MLRTFLFFISFLSTTTLLAQNNEYLETLKKGVEIGQPVPDVEAFQVTNYKDSTLHLSNFKGKLVILDFWNTACGSCIAAFPELDSLQKKYSDKLQIIAVNEQSLESINKFIKRFKIQLPNFPFVIGDSVFSALFPHHFVPHHVWISESGEVLEITGGRNTNESTLKRHFEGKKLDLYQVKYIEDANPETPIRDVFSGYVSYYSVISHTPPSVGGFNKFGPSRPGSNVNNLLAKRGAAIIELFKTAYSENGKYNFQARNTVRLTGIDTIAYFYPSSDSLHDYWLKNNSYNYDLVVPENLSEKLFFFMQQDLNRYFNVKTKIRIEKKQAIVIHRIRNSNIEKLMSVQKMSPNPHDSSIIYRRMGMNAFALSIQNLFSSHQCSLPIVDKTDYFSDIYIRISRTVINNTTVENLNHELSKYGLQVTIERVKYPVLEIIKI